MTADAPVVIEHLVFEVDTEVFERWQAAEHEHWTVALGRWPGYLGKETWVQDRGDVRRVSIAISWRRQADWDAVDPAWVAAQDAAVAAAIGGAEHVRLVHAGHADGVHWHRVSSYRPGE